MPAMNHPEQIAQEQSIRPSQVTAVIELLDSGNTIPFIARYRKEATGSLDEEQIRAIEEQVNRLRALDERRETILASITEQEKMTPELRAALLAAATLTELEDLYQPYKPKRRTRATIAREKGLEPLAALILAQPRSKQSIDELASPFLTEAAPTIPEALAGAYDIVAEIISDNAVVRQRVREKVMQYGILHSQKIDDAVDEKAVYHLYYDYQTRVDRLRPHQILALNRGETEKILRLSLEIAENDWLIPMRSVVRPDFRRSPLAEPLQLCMNDAAQRLLLPAIERDVRRALTDMAEEHAIRVFAANLRGLLSQPPLAGHIVLAIDPGYRTGCKVAIIDATGKVLDTSTIYPHPPQKKWDETLKQLALLIARFQVTLIAIGNGTASRETEQLAAELTRQLDQVHYLMVNEAGASVYSASKLAKQEMPDLDVTLRGAVSIGRRVQDPLAELVKIDPKSIGVGMYQHDVNQTALAASLDGVVESVVNQVGVDLNTASPALLTYVSGIGPKLAEKIVAYRDKNGRFPNRQALLKVNGLGSKAFEQSAGFLRIREGDEPLDASAIHPESYGVATAVLQRAGLKPTSQPADREIPLQQLRQRQPLDDLAADLQTGVPTLLDIFEQLVRPGRDPREDLPQPILRSDVLSMDDLLPGMRLNGTVRNVVDFGVFIDIGVKQDGLLHRSQIPRDEALNVGDVLEIAILKVEKERNRISLGWPEE
ncbi:MAG: RNA-binding transcriptional accessory protein [Ardenticatenaceae bacterium]|nr:RNA-binding transcriptional accessory protein [Ardenticatenaceae bacterium]